MKYVTHNGHQLCTKNKLEKAVADYLSDIDRTLIESADIETYKNELLADIKEFESEHPRCKPLKAHWFETSKNDFILSGVYFSHFHIYHINKTFI